MKYIHTVVLLTALLIALTSCSPDIEEDEAIVEEEESLLTSTPVYEVPHWADGTITIRTGVYETGTEMVNAILGRENFWADGVTTRANIKKIPMSQIPSETEVTVLTLREVGIESAATIAEIRSRFGVEGYRPLTLEEAVMIRLDFNDQPATQETMNKKMTEFWTLLSQEDGLFIAWHNEEMILEVTFRIGRYLGFDFIGAGYIIKSHTITDHKFHLEEAFACVKKNP